MPGETRFLRPLGRLVLIRDVLLNSAGGEASVDAVLDTGAAYRIIPRQEAERLGFSSDNRRGFYRVRGVGGVTTMALHRLEYVQAGTARAHNVSCLVGGSPSDFILLGMSFIERFQTTLDLDATRVLFRPRRSG